MLFDACSGAHPGMTPPSPVRANQASPLRCFLVEDSPVIRQNLVATLEELLAIEMVGTAEDERGALEWLRSGADCDLMIVDIFLRQGTGLEVLRQARTLHPESRLVVLTNFATTDMRKRCAQLGADAVFDKSNEIDALVEYCIAQSEERQAGA